MTALLICGTSSDAGKTVLVAGLCRLLARNNIRVAPFKAQNMALNSMVTADGAEIGRAQALQAMACGIEPTAHMNPVLLKPNSDTTSQVIVRGKVAGVTDAKSYGQRTAQLKVLANESLARLREEYDVVICEGAGSLAEINLRDRDIVNMGLARSADIPVLLASDIERGGVYAAMYGSWAVLDEADKKHLAGFIINRFRGDESLLTSANEWLAEQTGVPVRGVLPYLPNLVLDAEDSLGIANRNGGAPIADGLLVAVIQLGKISNFTDVDAFAQEPGVTVIYTTSPGLIKAADLVVIPGSKQTLDDLAMMERNGLVAALRERHDKGDPILGICGGLQMLGQTISDPDGVEAQPGAKVAGLGFLPIQTVFEPTKLTRQVAGYVPELEVNATGYEIRHGRIFPDNDHCLFKEDHIFGTAWHGIFEGDDARRAFLKQVASKRALEFIPGDYSHAERRIQMLDRVADSMKNRLDLANLGLPITGLTL